MAKKSKKWKDEHDVHRMPWPAQSPGSKPHRKCMEGPQVSDTKAS